LRAGGGVLLRRDGPLSRPGGGALLRRDGPLSRPGGGVLLRRDGPLSRPASTISSSSGDSSASGETSCSSGGGLQLGQNGSSVFHREPQMGQVGISVP